MKNQINKPKQILATLCYVRSHGKTLMIHRIKKQEDMHKGKWNGLGGKIEVGESPEENVIREVKEESGLTISKPQFKGLISFPSFGGLGEQNDWHVFIFVVNKFIGKLKENQEGHLAWIDDDKLLELNLWEGDRIFIPWLSRNKIFLAKFIYKNEKLKNHQVSFY